MERLGASAVDGNGNPGVGPGYDTEHNPDVGLLFPFPTLCFKIGSYMYRRLANNTTLWPHSFNTLGISFKLWQADAY